MARNTNLSRAQAAAEAAESYAPGNDLFTAMGDLLCDLHHAADQYDLSWEGLLAQGDFHYYAEVDED